MLYTLKMNDEDIKKIIKLHKKTQTEIAKKIGVRKSYISQLVHGKNVSKLCAFAMCKAISSDLEIEDLFKIV